MRSRIEMLIKKAAHETHWAAFVSLEYMVESFSYSMIKKKQSGD